MDKVRKLRNIIILGISVFCLIFIISVLSNFKYYLKNSPSNATLELPCDIEFMGCAVDIEYVKYCPNLLVTKYSIRTNDGSDLGKHMSWTSKTTTIDKDVWFDESHVPDSGYKIVLDIEDKSGTISYGITLGDKMIKKVSDDKYEFINLYGIGAKNKDSINNESMNVKFTLINSKLTDEKKELDSLYKIKKDFSCKDINSTITLENLNFTVKSLGEFEFGKVLYFYIEDTNINNYELENSAINSDKYTLRFKGKNSSYDKDWKWAFRPRNDWMVKDFKVSEDFKGDTNIIYTNYVVIPNRELDEVSEICLVNKETGLETLVYSK